jgi:hypothetical protein
MKPIPLVFFTVLFLTASVRSQDEDAAVSGESTVGPLALPTTARILGNIPDGTPPPPPQPVFIVPAADILAATTRSRAAARSPSGPRL